MILFVVDSRNVGNQQGGTMGTVSTLSRRDTRIFDEIRSAFPESPAFVDYLVARLRGSNGSLHVARIFINVLKQSFPNACAVSGDDVQRLGVDDDQNAISKMCYAFFERNIQAFDAATVLSIHLQGDVVAKDDSKTIDDITVVSNSSIDSEMINEYIRIFFCSYAMFCGLEISPREMAA